MKKSVLYGIFLLCGIALMALSIPRKIVVMDDRVEIRCLLDITEIRRVSATAAATFCQLISSLTGKSLSRVCASRASSTSMA